MRDDRSMSATTVQPVFKDAAHRRAVMQRLGASIVPAAIAFGVLGPLIGVALVWSGALIMLVSAAITGAVPLGGALLVLAIAVGQAYMIAGFAAAITGVWVAVFSPFARSKLQFYLGAAAIGGMSAWLFLLGAPANVPVAGGPFMAIAGAVSSAVCARLCTNWPLQRGEDGRQSHRDRLARARAERLAKERAAA